MKKIKNLLLLIGFAGVLSSCDTSVPADSTSAKYAQNETDIQTYLTTKNLTANTKRTSSGVYIVTNTANPTGKSVVVGQQIVFNYVASLLNETVYDSTYSGIKTPFKANYGVNYNLPWGSIIDALGNLHEGEKATLILPSYLAYGASSSSLIPAYSVLKYDVTVIAFNSEIQQIKNYVTAKNLIVTDTTATSLRYIRTAEGTGDLVKAGQSITLNYTGSTLADQKFDSNTFTFVLGSGAVVKGFDEGVSKMKVGEKATIIFPSAIGYGTAGSNAIAPYTPLRFDLEIVSAK